jgi:LysM repeat protein
MAYVEQKGLSHEALARVLRNGARALAFATYGTAVAVALVILSPVLFARGSSTVELPVGPTAVTAKVEPGESASAIAAEHGLGLSHYFVLNPGTRTFDDRDGKPVVVAWR